MGLFGEFVQMVSWVQKGRIENVSPAGTAFCSILPKWGEMGDGRPTVEGCAMLVNEGTVLPGVGKKDGLAHPRSFVNKEGAITRSQGWWVAGEVI